MVYYLYLLINCVNMCPIHFHCVHLLYLVYIGYFLNTMVFFGPFWRPLWLSALGSRIVRLMVALAGPALQSQKDQAEKASQG